MERKKFTTQSIEFLNRSLMAKTLYESPSWKKSTHVNDVFFEPMDDITKQLSSTWDASYLMMPRAGTLGPPPMLAGFEDDIETMEDFFEPESGDPMLVARITGSVEPEDSALDGVPDALTEAKDHTETAVERNRPTENVL